MKGRKRKKEGEKEIGQRINKPTNEWTNKRTEFLNRTKRRNQISFPKTAFLVVLTTHKDDYGHSLISED